MVRMKTGFAAVLCGSIASKKIRTELNCLFKAQVFLESTETSSVSKKVSTMKIRN